MKMFRVAFGSNLRDQVIPVLMGIAVASGQFGLIIPVGLFCLMQIPLLSFIKASRTLHFLVVFLLVFLVCFKRPTSLDYGYLTLLWVLGLALSLLIAFIFGCGIKSFKEAEISFLWVGVVAFLLRGALYCCYDAVDRAPLLWESV